MSKKMQPGDPASWMLFDGVETTPVVHSETCYICRDSEFAQMGLPLCRKCPACGGHVQADDTTCDECGLCDQSFWELVGARSERVKLKKCFTTGAPNYEQKDPSVEELHAAAQAFDKAVSE